MKSHLILFCTVAQVLSFTSVSRSAPNTKGELVKVTQTSGRAFIGELIEEGKEGVRLRELRSGREGLIKKSTVHEIERTVSDSDAAQYCGFPKLLAWKIKGLASQEAKVGKIARVTATTVYLTLGDKHGISKGDKLNVYRVAEEVKDPDTGKVIAVERSRIAELSVFECQEAYSKAKLVGDLEVKLATGDEVELPRREIRVAVLPLVGSRGTETSRGQEMADEITTSLVQNRTKVVERSLLLKAIGELAIQNTLLFEAKSAQKIGKHLGASTIVAGKIYDDKVPGKAFVRLIDVQTGEVMLAASTTLNKTETSTASKPSQLSTSKKPSGDAGSLIVLGGGNSAPSYFNFTNAGLTKGGVVFEKSGLRAWTKQGTFASKDFVFEVVVEFMPRKAIPTVGLGSFDAKGRLGKAMYLRLHTPDIGASTSLFNSAKGGHGTSLGHLKTRGPHKVTIRKKGQAVTFSIDVDNDGPTDDDLEMTVPSLEDAAPFFHGKNMHIFFGDSGAIYKSVSLKVSN